MLRPMRHAASRRGAHDDFQRAVDFGVHARSLYRDFRVRGEAVIRVYFHQGNRIKSKLYDAQSVTTFGKLLTIDIKITTVGIVHHWFRGDRPTADTHVRTIAEYAPGEWIRWEWEPDSKEEKSDGGYAEVRT